MVEVNNLTRSRIDKKYFKEIARKILEAEKKENLYLSIVFVRRNEIKELNKKFRKKNKVTDVLSFGAEEISDKNPFSEVSEIVICPDTVKKNAAEFKTKFRTELKRVLIHGVLHVLGYDHEKEISEAKKMFKKEESYLCIV